MTPTIPGELLWPDIVGLHVYDDRGRRGIVTSTPPGPSARVYVSWGDGADTPVSTPVSPLRVRLNRAGRVHAAWWVDRQDWGHLSNNAQAHDMIWVRRAMEGEPMTHDQIRALRDLCLRLAGREVTA